MDEQQNLRETILARIGELKKNRDQYIRQAELQIAAFNAAIGELEHILNPDNPSEKTSGQEAMKRVVDKRGKRAVGALNGDGILPASGEDTTPSSSK
jgi:hypothetical protein